MSSHTSSCLYSLAMSGFDNLSEDIKRKLAAEGYVKASLLPYYDAPVSVWQVVQEYCKLTSAEITEIQKAIKPISVRSQGK